MKKLAWVIAILGISTLSMVKKKSEYFEGDLYYSLTYLDEAKDTIKDSLMLKYLGVTVHTVIKDKKEYSKYFNQNGELLSTRLMNLEDNTYKLWTKDFDSVLYFLTNEQETGATITDIKDTIFKGTKVKQLSVSGYYINNYAHILNGEYYYDIRLKKNPENFKNYKEGDYYKLVSKLPYIYRFKREEYFVPYYRVNITELDSFVRRKVVDAEFENLIPDHLPLKKI